MGGPGGGPLPKRSSGGPRRRGKQQHNNGGRTPPSGRTTFARSTRRRRQRERGPEKSSSSPQTRKSALSLLPSPRGETALPTVSATAPVAAVRASRKCASESERREVVDVQYATTMNARRRLGTGSTPLPLDTRSSGEEVVDATLRDLACAQGLLAANRRRNEDYRRCAPRRRIIFYCVACGAPSGPLLGGPVKRSRFLCAW